jgi:polyferredoxin
MWVQARWSFLVPAASSQFMQLSASHRLIQPQTTDPKRKENLPFAVYSGGQAWLNSDKCPCWLLPQEKATPCGGQWAFRFVIVALDWLVLGAQVSGRRLMQGALLVLALAVIADGFLVRKVSSANLAGVLPELIGELFVVIALLTAANFFCMACPFTLFRELGRQSRTAPTFLAASTAFKIGSRLRCCGFSFGLTKPLTCGDKPIWTAGLIINYFLIAFAIDALFSRASFCKYVCPIGQFQFIASLVSPLEVKVRDPDVCADCQTHDCLRGNARQRGCEMDLYLPRKSGNFDCTFCLDCVRACPHDNVGVMAVPPGP